jgi:hypothetical protein
MVGAFASRVARKPIQMVLVILTLCIAVLASAIVFAEWWAGHLPFHIECCAPPFLKAVHAAPLPGGETVAAVRLRG